LGNGFGALGQFLGPDRLVSSRSHWADVVRYESRLHHGFLRSRSHPFASEEPCHCDVLESATRDRCNDRRATCALGYGLLDTAAPRRIAFIQAFAGGALLTMLADTMMPVQRGLTQFVSSETPQQHILLAATAMSVLRVMVLYAFAQRYITQGLLEGAVKG